MTAPQFEDSDLHVETTTIMFADVVESTILIEQDDLGTLKRIRSLIRELQDVALTLYSGAVLEVRGDGLLVKFDSAVTAVACAEAFHQRAKRVSSSSVTTALTLRIGIHHSPIFVDEEVYFGKGITYAARLTSLAEPEQTVVSADARSQLTYGLDGDLVDLGDCFVKHVVQPIRAYRVVSSVSSPSVPDVKLADLSLPTPRVRLAVVMNTHISDSSRHVTNVLQNQWIDLFSRSSALEVISRQSCRAFYGRSTPWKQVAELLDAHYVLVGEAKQIGVHQRVMVTLWRRTDLDPIWQTSVSLSASDAIESSSDASLGIVTTALESICATERVVARGASLPNLPTHTLYLNAIDYLHRFSRVDFVKSRDMLLALIERAPRHAAPKAWLARWHVFNVVQGWSSDTKFDGNRALSYARRALDHDPESSLALAMAGSVEAGVNRDLDAANQLYGRSLKSNPNEPIAWLLKGVAHGFQGQSHAAIESSQRALALTPLDPMRFYYDSLSSAAALGARQYELAASLADRAIRANRMHGSAYRTLAIAQQLLGDGASAHNTVQRLLAIEPTSSVAQFRTRASVSSVQNEEYASALLAAGLPSGIRHDLATK